MLSRNKILIITASLKPKLIGLTNGWRKERALGGGSLVSSIMGNELSAWLRGVKAASGGVIAEIFVMDNVDLNVG